MRRRCMKVLFCILTLSILSIFLILLLSAIQSYDRQAAAQSLPRSLPSSSNFLTYTNPASGIQIQYPDDWQTIEGSILRGIDTGNFTAMIQFVSADNTVSVTVAVEKLIENLTLEQYAERYIASLEEYDPNARIIERNTTTTLAGIQGYKIVHSGEVDIMSLIEELGLGDIVGDLLEFQPVNRTTMSFLTIDGDNGYGITYTDANAGLFGQLCETPGAELLPECALLTSTQEPYTHYLPIAEKMIDSFEILKGNQTNDNNTRSQVPNGTADEDPCSIIDRRLAIGEITTEEHEALRVRLGC